MSSQPQTLPEWGYDGEIGPQHWGDLCPAYAMAKNGKEQSPIDIPSASPINPPDLVFDYQASELSVVNNGHTIQVNYAEGSFLQVDGTQYALRQYHFHNPSETTVDGQAADMEIHLVHVNEFGQIAVVGAFLVEGEESAAYAPVFDNMPVEKGESVFVEGVMINAIDLLPDDQTYWRYDGSLTTPPCTEGVKWFMFKQPIEISGEQLAKFKSLYTGNARPVQPMHERSFIVGQQRWSPPPDAT